MTEPDVAVAEVDSRLGRLLLAATPAGLVRLAYVDGGSDAVRAGLAARVSPRIGDDPARLDGVRRALDAYFAGQPAALDGVAVDQVLVGPFGRRVLGVCAAVPYGDVSSYARLAAAIGAPRSARAVGNALGANPVPIVVPCHRVVRGDGSIGGYTGGTGIKERLLALEGVRR